MDKEMYVVTAEDGNRFLSYKIDGRWVATKSGSKVSYFTEGYIVSWVKI